MMGTSVTRPRLHHRVGTTRVAWYERGMYLENLVVDAQDPTALGRFWAGLLEAGPTLLDDIEAGGYFH